MNPRADSNGQCSHLPHTQGYLVWLKEHWAYGCDASSDWVDECDKPFIPKGLLRSYLGPEDNRIENLLLEIFPSGVPPSIDSERIRRYYLHVFAILVYIGKGQFIEHFLHVQSLRDNYLPFDTRPTAFPEPLGNEPDFHVEFRRAQRRFWLPSIDNNCYETWSGDWVLPILDKKRLGNGVSAITYKIELHPDYNGLLTPQHEAGDPFANTFVLKTYYTSDAASDHKAEVDAFLHIRRQQNAAGWNIIEYFGTFTHGDTLNVIVEYANEGNLEEYFEKFEPPEEQKDIYTFYKAFLELIEALDSIHNNVYNQCGNIQLLQGFHQDVKPENILVSTRNGHPKFKLADLGLAHFHTKIRSNSRGSDTRGTRTYGAPECYRWNEAMERSTLYVHALIDVWSLGCCTSEAATWVVSGKRGLDRYREARMQEIKTFRNFKDADCFHNGTEVLPCVQEHHRNLNRKAKRLDDLTKKIIDMVEYMMLLHEKYRADTRSLIARCRMEIFPESSIDAVAHMHVEANLSSPPALHGTTSRGVAGRQSAMPTVTIPSSEYGPVRSPTNGVCFTPDTPRTSTASPYFMRKPSVSSPTNDRALNNNFELPSSREGPPQSPRSINTFLHELGSPRIQPSETSPSLRTAPYDETTAVHTSMGAPNGFPMVTETSSQYLRQTQSSVVTPVKGKKPSPKLPTWLVADALIWKKEKKSGKMVEPLSEPCMTDIGTRNVKFLVDNSGSMHRHWEDATAHLSILGYVAKESDQDGVDLHYLIDSKRSKGGQNCKNSTDLVNSAAANKPKNDPDRKSNVGTKLGEILYDYCKQLDKERAKGRFMPEKFKAVRPLSIFVLTDGEWLQDFDAQKPIADAVDKLEELRKPRNQLGIQFVFFGDNRHYWRRVTRLDKGLGLQRDIVDSVRAGGNVWKMFLGPLLDIFDKEEEEEDDYDEEESDVPALEASTSPPGTSGQHTTVNGCE